MGRRKGRKSVDDHTKVRAAEVAFRNPISSGSEKLCPRARSVLTLTARDAPDGFGNQL